MRNLLFATATALLLGACATAPLHIDTRHESAIQASRVQFLILHYTVADFEALCAEHGVPTRRLGEVTGDDELEFVGLVTTPLAEARDAWSSTLPAALN